MATDYRALPGLNWSLLKHMSDSPMAYRHARDADPEPPTTAQQVGTLCHARVLEPHLLADQVAVWRGTSTRTKAYRAWASEQGDRTILAPRSRVTDAGTWSLLRAAPRAIRRHPAARTLLSHGEAEVPMRWLEVVEGVEVECKGLADWLVREPTEEQRDALGLDDGQPILCDLKFLATLDRLPSQVARYRYHGQLAHYASGVLAHTGHTPAVFLLAIDKQAPHDVALLRLDTTDALEAGERLRWRLLTRLVACEATDRWPGAHPGVTDLHLPGWADGASTEESP